MNIKQMKALADAKAQEAFDEWAKDEPDEEKARELEAKAVEYSERLQRMQKLMTIREQAADEGSPEGKARIVKVEDEVDRKSKDPDLQPYKSLGEQLMDVYNAGRNFAHPSPRLIKAHQEAAKAVSGASEAVPTDGGILVQTDLAAGIIEPVYQTGQLLSRVEQVTISGNANSYEYYAVSETSRATGSRWGGVRAYRLDEGDQITSSKPTFERRRIDLFRVGVLAYATGDVLNDAALLETEIGNAARDELAFFIDDDVMNGNGTGQPLCFLNSSNAALVAVSKETGQAADTIVAENISKMWARRVPGLDYVWIINQDVEPQLDTLAYSVGTGGQLVYMPPGGLADAPYGRLKGRPVLTSEQSATLGDQGDICLVALREYKFASKGGIQQAMSIHVRFEYDESVFRFLVRYGGKPRWASALTPFKGTGNTISPYVTLAARA